MKISALYFFSYPDGIAPDPNVAASEVRVEVGEGEPTHEAFDTTYSFKVYTLGFLEAELRTKGKSFMIDRSTIIISRFDPLIVERAIESILNRIKDYGEEV